MKKLFTLGVASLMALSSAFAETVEPSLTVIEGGFSYGGYMPLDISNDGTYVCGSCDYTWMMFTSIWQQQNTKVYNETNGSAFEDWGAELDNVKDSGWALGWDDLGNLMVNCNTYEIKRLYLDDPKQGATGAMVLDMNADGSIIVGIVSVGGDGKRYPAYWENGVYHPLPYPTEEDMGVYNNGCRAQWISDDGSVIVGWIIDRMASFPMVYWTRQEDGSYELHNLAKEYWYDAERSPEKKAYLRFRPDAVSNNGEHVVLTLKLASPDGVMPTEDVLGRLNLKTGEFSQIVADGSNRIPRGAKLQVYLNGVANDGTIAGYTFTTTAGVSFIIYPDETQPQILSDLFPEISRFDDYEVGPQQLGGEYKVSAISGDGRYVTGVGLAMVNANLDLYEAFVLDMGVKDNNGDSGIGSVETVKGTPVYYSIDGQRHSAPVKGINIVRMPDGSTQKVIIK